MSQLSNRKLVIVTRQTRADELIKKYNNMAQAAFHLEKMGGNFDEYLEEARVYKDAVGAALRQFEGRFRMQLLDRELVPNFIFGKDDVVIVIGPDGLVANTLKYLDGQPLIAANPDPARYDGILLPFQTGDLPQVVQSVLAGHQAQKEITMARASLSDGQSMLAVNDLFIGRRTHVSARYGLRIDGREEMQSSSGIIVSTGLGSTGWLRSVIAGAKGIAAALAGAEISGDIKAPQWNSNYLYYSVREPFPSNTTGTSLTFGQIKNKPLRIASHMPEDGVIFSDGVEQDYLSFNSGIEARIEVAPKKGLLVV